MKVRQIFPTLLCLLSGLCHGQVYTPTITKIGQVDATSLKSLTEGIYARADANTPREKAEAIWRFFLTDGRFVKPGIFYHIAGWAYEEPSGEVLDPIKLLNSYGFGLCYHIAPLLEAAFDAGGFADARVWFLTGHTVAEVFYDGQYHYFDSDMMGYNVTGSGPLQKRRVASVHDIEQDGSIILSKLTPEGLTKSSDVNAPWYPADVRANAIGELAQLFTTTNDNLLYPYKRYSQAHAMSFVLRPGERMIRYFEPESKDLYYLPYHWNGKAWQEFPKESAEYKIRTLNGPQSQKDARRWATGKLEYRPKLSDAIAGKLSNGDPSVTFDMPCPYVIIDAHYAADLSLSQSGSAVTVESSVDGGRTWTKDAAVQGPFQGKWNSGAAIIVKSEHGKLTDVSGTYGYKVRLSVHGSDLTRALYNVTLTTTFQLNPRTLPALKPGNNEMQYRSSDEERTEVPIQADHLDRFASDIQNATYTSTDGQGYFRNESSEPGQITFALTSPEARDLIAFEAGARFLDLRDGLAPDKLTAEIRKIAPWPAKDAPLPSAQIAWSLHPDGPFQILWTYNANPAWKDGQPINRRLNWPEVDQRIDRLPAQTKKVFIRYTFAGMAIDSFRLAAITPATRSASTVTVTQLWTENGVDRSNKKRIDPRIADQRFTIPLPTSAKIQNKALILECP